MAVAKKAVGKAAGGKKPDVAHAVDLALKVIDNPAVIATLDRASAAVKAWAVRAREHRDTRATRPVTDAQRPSDAKSGRFVDRFGQKGLEHRSTELRQAAAAAFPDPTGEGRVELERALDQIDRYLAAVGRLPLVKRKQGHWKADDMLDRLEDGLVRALDPGRSM